jgi:signal transduction histidine kinase
VLQRTELAGAFDLGWFVLQDFLTINRAVLVERCRVMVSRRSVAKDGEPELAHGIPIFLDQVIDTLSLRSGAKPTVPHSESVESGEDLALKLAGTAKLHGRDLFREGFTIEQVVRDYGDVCQAVTTLAFETGADIAVDEFRTFNRCLDNAIAGAVTEYASFRNASTPQDVGKLDSRIGHLVHELRNYLQTITVVVKAIKTGNVGTSGATGAILDRSLIGMHNLIDRALTEVRADACVPPQFKRLELAHFLRQVESSAAVDAMSRGVQFLATLDDSDAAVYVDREMIFSAIGNLLHNAFKFTKSHSDVHLHSHIEGKRVLIDVKDQCGGLPNGATEGLFLPFSQKGVDRSGVGLGLDICKRNVEANNGKLSVLDVPGFGCIFTIDLPLHS